MRVFCNELIWLSFWVLVFVCFVRVNEENNFLNFYFRSLGVLLYTLVYGAMPFDGSNFKRLVKQITTGDYYEPKKPAGEKAWEMISYVSSYLTFHLKVELSIIFRVG